MTDLLIVNHSALVADQDVLPWINAIQKQVSSDFSPFWGTDATLHLGAAPEGAWQITLKDAPDDPNDLGFHLLDNGAPEARVFIQPTLNVGQKVSGVLSHEVLEMLADPSADRMASDGVHIIEVCDPVQQNGYEIDGVFVSDFVTPAYFGFNSDTRYDFSRQLGAPLDRLLPGGYLLYLTGGQWQMKFGDMTQIAAKRAMAKGRSSWRKSRSAPSA